jgi:hypothetical protein
VNVLADSRGVLRHQNQKRDRGGGSTARVWTLQCFKLVESETLRRSKGPPFPLIRSKEPACEPSMVNNKSLDCDGFVIRVASITHGRNLS